MSNRQKQILAETGAFKLIKRKKKDRHWYEIEFDSWDHQYDDNPNNLYEQVRDFFDPLRNKGGKWGTHWKFSNRKDAEQMFLAATLKWTGQ
jgi:hypothetical protein